MADEPGYADVETGGPEGAPRSPFGRIVRPLLILVVLVLIASAIAAGAAAVPSGTDSGALAARAALGLAIGVVLVVFVRRMLRALVEPPPPSPEKVPARSADVVYECPVCGTRVRLEVAATGKAPKHCSEEMEPRIG